MCRKLPLPSNTSVPPQWSGMSVPASWPNQRPLSSTSSLHVNSITRSFGAQYPLRARFLVRYKETTEKVGIVGNKVQFQKGLSETEFNKAYGSEEQCHAALVNWRWPNGPPQNRVFCFCSHTKFRLTQGRNQVMGWPAPPSGNPEVIAESSRKSTLRGVKWDWVRVSRPSFRMSAPRPRLSLFEHRLAAGLW